MARKNKRKRINRLKNLCMYGRLVKENKTVAFCKLHKCYLQPKDIKEKKCNIKKCIHIDDLKRRVI